MSARNSCGFLAREAHRNGRTPTTPTTSAVIAGIQVQEAVKLLHKEADLPNLVDKGYFFDGNSYDCFVINYVRKDDCLSHETFESVVETDLTGKTASLADVMAQAAKHLRGGIVVDLPDEMVVRLHCRECGSDERVFRLLDSMDTGEAKCSNCGRLRVPETVSECAPDSVFASIPLADLGFGVMDIVTARSGDDEAHIEISGDRSVVFGCVE
jgi:adenylyltransferase/sulfurtransferase